MNNTGKKFGGRVAGTPNKLTTEIRDKISVILQGTLDSIDISTFNRMEKTIGNWGFGVRERGKYEHKKFI